MKVSNFWIC